ncbi:hypothetical protein PO81_00245, partial [Vibrio parahaemolyticus]
KIAGPNIIPQKPKVEIPAIIAKKIKSSLILVGVFTSFLLIHLMIKGLIKVSAIKEITITE